MALITRRPPASKFCVTFVVVVAISLQFSLFSSSVQLLFVRLLTSTENDAPATTAITDDILRTRRNNQRSQLKLFLNSTAFVSEPQQRDEKVELRENEVLQLWNQYKKEHSHQALTREFQQHVDEDKLPAKDSNATVYLNGRKFAVGYYSCPFQAGNRLHHFFNSLIWSIVTNRTLLYRYFDKRACQGVTMRKGGGDWTLCKAANTRQECDEILERADFLPSFKEWMAKLKFQRMKKIPFWSTHEKLPNHKRWKPKYEKYAGLADSTDFLIVEFAPMLGQDASLLKSERKRNYLLTTNDARERARKLLQLGPDFLYGLLFHDCFKFQPSVMDTSFPALPASDINKTAKSLLIVLHSRHSKRDDDGSKIRPEQKCLEKLIMMNQNLSSCTVVLLSDRPKTLELLQVHIATKFPYCQAQVANHKNGTSWRPEHGPFAGIGFYQDLAMVKHSVQSLGEGLLQVGFIGSKDRSSSQLVKEILAYHHQRLLRLQGGEKENHDIQICHF